MNSDPCFLTIRELGQLMDARRLSPVELTRAYLGRIEVLDPRVNAFIRVTADRAMDEARRAEREIAAGGRRGPLHGIAYALKDIYDTQGIATTGHSRLLADRVPEADSTVVQRFKAAGGILLGKLATHEFAVGGPSFDLPWPPARNPWALQHFSGGSSSGSAAGVAAGFFPCAAGSDTGGSIRLPASLCGVAGIKPTAGRVSKKGVLPLSYSLDVCGPLAWTVADCALVLQAIAGYDPGDPGSAGRPVPDFLADLEKGVAGIRVGVVRHFYQQDRPAAAATIAAMDEAVATLARDGAEIVDVTLPPLHDFAAAHRIIVLAESFAIYADDLRRHPHLFGQMFRYRTVPGAFLTADDYVQALRQQRRFALRALDALRRVDVLVTATAFDGAPRLDRLQPVASYADPSLTAPFNFCNLPTVSVCNGFTSLGLPLGMQVVGRPWDEATVLRVAHAYERATDWRTRRPDVESQHQAATCHAPFGATTDRADGAVTALLDRAGVPIVGDDLAGLGEAWGHVGAMRARLPRDRAFADEMASQFAFPLLPT